MQTWKNARRKRRIDRIDGENDCYDNLHQYSKNKVLRPSDPFHKTNNKNQRRNNEGEFAPSTNWKPSDRRSIDDANQQIEEELSNCGEKEL
jgi:hypothetical protein